ncbi:MAG: citramalate synthase [Candidatus Calescibacterium sp.]|nr:citramalate synthase [Candidatus Calescibacterium sp.]MCX7733261.1 citramalate synthase [bacterium]MDW8087674.1 citramalate synthase [Candidatus Calescibacterium sp.]
MSDKVYIYDTTLRDGAQGLGSSWTLEDKIRITNLLDDFGIDYIEGGWPGSNPKDKEYFENMKKVKLKNSKLVAFGSTTKAEKRPENDQQVVELVKAETPTVTIYGKSWDLHVEKVLRTTLKENLRMIKETVQFLKKEGREVIFDAEHFFDGAKANKDYAFSCIESAIEGGADWIVLCDTNGGSLPNFISQTVMEIIQKFGKIKLGIHLHNDLDLAVANSITAVIAGVRQVQGTINGLGERCGNANLTSIIPILKLKLGFELSQDISKLKHVADVIWELSNISPPRNQPFVGESAFAHKGGVHIDAIVKDMASYEHMNPEVVGNKRKIVISDLAGKTAIKIRLEELGLEADEKTVKSILDRIKELEKDGYDFEVADASLDLLILEEMKRRPKFFDVEGFTVSIYRSKDDDTHCLATVKLKVNGVSEHTASDGNGPVNALDKALRKALERFFPELKEMELSDFKVRVVSGSQGTGAKVRVFIESRDKDSRWGSVGVSENIILASWKALVDSIEYKLAKERNQMVIRKSRG